MKYLMLAEFLRELFGKNRMFSNVFSVEDLINCKTFFLEACEDIDGEFIFLIEDYFKPNNSTINYFFDTDAELNKVEHQIIKNLRKKISLVLTTLVLKEETKKAIKYLKPVYESEELRNGLFALINSMFLTLEEENNKILRQGFSFFTGFTGSKEEISRKYRDMLDEKASIEQKHICAFDYDRGDYFSSINNVEFFASDLVNFDLTDKDRENMGEKILEMLHQQNLNIFNRFSEIIKEKLNINSLFTIPTIKPKLIDFI